MWTHGSLKMTCLCVCPSQLWRILKMSSTGAAGCWSFSPLSSWSPRCPSPYGCASRSAAARNVCFLPLLWTKNVNNAQRLLPPGLLPTIFLFSREVLLLSFSWFLFSWTCLFYVTLCVSPALHSSTSKKWLRPNYFLSLLLLSTQVLADLEVRPFANCWSLL